MAENDPAQQPQPTPTSTPPQQPEKQGGYGKRPLWQWVLLYVIIGGLVYFAIYYFYFRNSYSSGSNTSQHSIY